MSLDPRLYAVRDDLADITLRARFRAPRYAEGRPARVAVGLLPVLHAPRPDAALDTFFHYGEALRVFEEADGYAWCQAARDSYVGYVDAAALAMGAGPPATHYIASMGAYRYAEPDLCSPAIDFLPRHAQVSVAQSGFECRGRAYVWLDGGGFLPALCLSTEPPRSADFAAAASLYLGCPYLWAGRSFLGIDCSGLVQEAFRDLGIAVPRDTDMQRETIGQCVAVARIADLRRNDLLFTSGHVLIWQGQGYALHADGANMLVRRQQLREFLDDRGLSFPELIVRRS